MSGQKKLDRATRNNRVLAFPSKKVKRDVLDVNGEPILDKNGERVEESVQLYRIRPMR